MRAATELARPVTEADDTNHVSVFLLEQVHSALRDGFLVRLLAVMKRQGLSHLLHDAPVDPRELILGDRPVEGDVEGRVVGPHP